MAEPMRNPGKLQEQINEFQNLQRQLQMIAIQHQQVQMQIEELKGAKEALLEAKGDVYMAVGNLIIQSTKAEAQKDVEEKIEVFGVRNSTLAKQEEKMRTRLDELRGELEKATREPQPEKESGKSS